MRVIIRNMGAATGHGPPSVELDLPEGATVDEALVQAGIPAEVPFVVFVDDRVANRSDRLSAGANMLVNVMLFPPAAGG